MRNLPPACVRTAFTNPPETGQKEIEMTTLSELAKQTESKRHEAFIVAVWKGEPADELLRLAREAGLALEQADRILARIANAQRLVPRLDDLPRLRLSLEVALGHSMKVSGKNNAMILELQNANNVGAMAARAAQLELNDAESVTREFHALMSDGLLPETVAPVEIRQQIARQKAGEVVQRREAALTNANNILRDVSRRLESLVARRADALLHIPDREALAREIETAKCELADAQSAVEDAATAVADARAKVPA
jgi:hypothetical protein